MVVSLCMYAYVLEMGVLECVFDSEKYVFLRRASGLCTYSFHLLLVLCRVVL